jgi:nickel-dependent lactate racemase
MPSARIRWSAWYDDTELELTFPDGWAVEQCDMHDAPDMDAATVAATITAPIGSPPLRELAQGKRSACIVIDDLSRPTQGRLLLPPVLDELDAAGIASDDVLLLGGVANHRPMVRADLLKKVGPGVLAKVRYRNHMPFDHCTLVGETSQGTPVEINDDYLAADLRILVGSIVPHGGAGFAGGAKLLMPGIASARTGLAYHRGPSAHGRYADVDGDARRDSEEAAAMVGVDFIVNMVPTSRMGAGAVVAGDVVAAHRAGVERAREIFATPTPAGRDVAVLSLYPKDTEFLQHLTAFAPWRTAPEPLVREGGTIVVALAGVEGFGTHWLFGPGMALDVGRPTRVRDRDVLIVCPNVEQGEVANGTNLFRTWSEARVWLEDKHGPTASASVYPCATIQLGPVRR